MSTPKDDGGPAFPTKREYRTEFGPGYEQVEGMTLRDWFAGQALAGSLASQCAESHWAFASLPNDQGNDQKAQSGIAMLCYQLADAMIEASKK